jgi:murein L,D-transpeptidase YafK
MRGKYTSKWNRPVLTRSSRNKEAILAKRPRAKRLGTKPIISLVEIERISQRRESIRGPGDDQDYWEKELQKERKLFEMKRTRSIQMEERKRERELRAWQDEIEKRQNRLIQEAIRKGNWRDIYSK